MAKREFTCAHCGVVGLQHAGTGRKRRFCSDRCRWNAQPRKPPPKAPPRPPAFMACLHCGTQVQKSKTKPTRYCGPTCRERAARAANPLPLPQPRECDRCGITYTPKKVSELGQTAFYCGNACKVSAWRDANPDRNEEHREAEHPGRIERRTARAVAVAARRERAAQRAIARAAWAKAVAEAKEARAQAVEAGRAIPCIDCGGSRGFAGRLRCKPCRQKEARRIKAISRKAGKLMRRGAKVVERFSPTEIFERDGWRCQICGVSTPRSRRGTRHHNAPEEDHIIPIAWGGEHSRANTQCACRRCNGEKGARYVVGQMGLFAA